MPEHMAFPVLTDEIAQVGSKTHVCDCGLVVSPFLHWEAFEEDEPFAIDEFFADRFEPCRKGGEREVLLGWCQCCVMLLKYAGMGDLRTFVIPVNGVPAALKSSAALLNSAISFSANGWVHLSELFL